MLSVLPSSLKDIVDAVLYITVSLPECYYIDNFNTISVKVMDLYPWFLINVQCLSVGSEKVGIDKKRWKGTRSMILIMNCQLGEFSISLIEILWIKSMLC